MYSWYEVNILSKELIQIVFWVNVIGLIEIERSTVCKSTAKYVIWRSMEIYVNVSDSVYVTYTYISADCHSTDFAVDLHTFLLQLCMDCFSNFAILLLGPLEWYGLYAVICSSMVQVPLIMFKWHLSMLRRGTYSRSSLRLCLSTHISL